MNQYWLSFVLLFNTQYAPAQIAPKPPPCLKYDIQENINLAFDKHLTSSIEETRQAMEVVDIIGNDQINPGKLGLWQEAIVHMVESNKHLDEAKKLLIACLSGITDKDSGKVRANTEMFILLFKESDELEVSARNACNTLNKNNFDILKTMRGTVTMFQLIKHSADIRFEAIKYLTFVVLNKNPDIDLPDLDPFKV